MDCDAFKQRIDELLDARRPLDADADLADHLRRCQPCRRWKTACEQLLECVGLVGDGPSLVAREEEPSETGGARPRRRGLPGPLAAVSSLAATILVAWMLFGSGARPFPGSSESAPPAAPGYASGRWSAGSAALPALSVHEDRGEVVVNAAPEGVPLDAVFSGFAGRVQVQDVTGLTRPLRETLKPVEETVRGAIHAVWRALPLGDRDVEPAASTWLLDGRMLGYWMISHSGSRC